MEEAKIKAFRVQITDLETGEKEVDEITTAVLCSTLTNATSDGGTYNCVMRCKEGLPAVSRYGLFKSCEKQMYKWFATVFVEAVKSGYRGVMKDFFEKMFNDADKLSETIKEHSYLLSDSINSRDYGMFLDGIMQAIDETHTAEVQEVRHGHWVGINGTLYCSKCQEKSKLEDYDDTAPFGGYAKTKFCHNCGAKMDEEEQK